MRSKHNQEQHTRSHYEAEALCQANEIASGVVFEPSRVHSARWFYLDRWAHLSAYATGAKELCDGRFDLSECVEVVPLGQYGDRDAMVAEMRWRYDLDVSGTLHCDGGEYRFWDPNLSEPDPGLPHLVLVAYCQATKVYSPMLVIAAPRQ